MPADKDGKVHLESIHVPLEHDLFLRTLLRHLSGALEDIIGLPETAGFVSIVGQRMGDEINDAYKAALNVSELTREQVAAVCVHLKRRIRGDFFLVEESEEKLVFGNRSCPFSKEVIGRSSLCMMTSSVFGTIVATNLGYAKVALEQTIARGAPSCRVVVYLKRNQETDLTEGREYVASQ